MALVPFKKPSDQASLGQYEGGPVDPDDEDAPRAGLRYLEALKGARAGQHSIRVNDRFRVCFVWRDGDAHEVEIVDYH